MVYQDVTRSELQPESKALYAYLAGFAGEGNTCYPSLDRICKEMHMSKNRVNKYMKELLEFGVIKKERKRNGNLLGNVVYTLTHEVLISEKSKPEKNTDSRLLKNKELGNRELTNKAYNNNNINKNNINNNSNNIISCPEPETPDRQPIITLTLNDKTEHPIYTEDFDEWAELYPAVDIMQALRSMKGWLNANPTRRKTKNGIRRFINSWLSREQDRGKAWTAADKKEAYDSNADLKAFAGVDDYDREEIIDMEEQDE